jgi:hypothetical protein
MSGAVLTVEEKVEKKVKWTPEDPHGYTSRDAFKTMCEGKLRAKRLGQSVSTKSTPALRVCVAITGDFEYNHLHGTFRFSGPLILNC